VSTMSSGPVHKRARWRKPVAYRSSLSEQHQTKIPRIVILRSSCRHILGVGYTRRMQGYLAFRSCR
jgi:hypothetical protein